LQWNRTLTLPPTASKFPRQSNLIIQICPNAFIPDSQTVTLCVL
jgi:hypothetical protein